MSQSNVLKIILVTKLVDGEECNFLRLENGLVKLTPTEYKHWQAVAKIGFNGVTDVLFQNGGAVAGVHSFDEDCYFFDLTPILSN